MSWIPQWQALSGRIGGLLEAVQIFTTLFQATHGQEGRFEHINRVLLPLGREVLDAVEEFRLTYGDVLPPHSVDAVQRYSEMFNNLRSHGLGALVGQATILAAMKSELDYLLTDQEVATIAVVERAFEHLQRTIVADEEQCLKWKKGFESKEPWCERMGATHLLWHGIWAFKADSRGERTDLILGTHIGGTLAERIRASGSRLVLTEWKLVRNERFLDGTIEKAKSQLQLYSQGSLAGIELRSARYAVIVSGRRLDMPPDETISGVLFRWINIATDPEPPSRFRVVTGRKKDEAAQRS